MSRKGLARCTGLLSNLSQTYDAPLPSLPGVLHQATAGSNAGFVRLGAKRKRFLSSQAQGLDTKQDVVPPTPNRGPAPQQPLSKIARQKQADREFFTDLLSSAATKRDAKAYLTRLKEPKKSISESPARKPSTADSTFSKPQVNVGTLFGRARAVDESPVFTQHIDVKPELGLQAETVHVALVKIADANQMSDHILKGIAQTLSQLSRLSMAPCVVLGLTTFDSEMERRQSASRTAERLATAIDASHDQRCRVLDNVMSLSEENVLEVHLRNLLLRPLQRGQIPIVVPIAYSTVNQRAMPISADETVLALTREFAGINIKPVPDDDSHRVADQYQTLRKQVSLDKIILVDRAGGISTSITGKREVFVNLEQEYPNLESRLINSPESPDSEAHISNLRLLRDALQLLPPSSSGLIASPVDAGAQLRPEPDQSLPPVGTRRQKNPLIHNLLTDKPAYSSSLPTGRLGQAKSSNAPPVMSTSTFVKRGMPLTILPNPTAKPWAADNHGQPRLKLTDPRIDLPRLVHLIDDSFDRKLDVEHYLNRVNNRIAGIIIAGEYEGGALLTWETPPGVDESDTSRLVPYLDKFAVLKRSQGAGGVADVLFNAMVRTCFPNGVCWRSRKDNPVNKWYFERSRGTWKIPETNWTMFWTTSDVTVLEQGKTFLDYEGVCRGVQPSWADGKKIVD